MNKFLSYELFVFVSLFQLFFALLHVLEVWLRVASFDCTALPELQEALERRPWQHLTDLGPSKKFHITFIKIDLIHL